MNESIRLIPKQEYMLRLENITVRMLRARATHTAPLLPSGAENMLHTHAHAELFACVQGAIHLQTATGILVLHAGDIAIVPQNFLHCKLPDTAPSLSCALDFICSVHKRSGGSELAKDLSQLLQPGVLVIARGQTALCEELWCIAQYDEQKTSYLPALQLANTLARLSHTSLQHLAPNEALTPRLPSPTGDADKDISRLDNLANLFAVYFMTDLTVDRAAKLLYISRRQLGRIMQREYGKSFHQVLCDQRVSAAEQMLGDRTLSISHIGTTVGFSSRAAFCRAFEKRHGISPAAFRKEKFGLDR